MTNDHHKTNIDILVETVVDKINFEEKNGHLEATSVTLVDKSGTKREVKARKEIIVSGGNHRRFFLLPLFAFVGKKEFGRADTKFSR